MTDSEIAELCRAIYRKHQRALDLICEHRPDPLSRLAEVLVEAIESTPGLTLLGNRNGVIQFALDAWEVPPNTYLDANEDVTRILAFSVRFAPDDVTLRLGIDPGDQRVRQAITAQARGAPAPLRIFGRGGQNWTTIYRRTLLTQRQIEKEAFDRQVQRLQDGWSRFVADDLPRIVAAIDVTRAARSLGEAPAALDLGSDDEDDDRIDA